MNFSAMSYPTQDPHNQTIFLNATDGTQVPFSLQDLNDWYLDGVVSCIQYASQIGASFILLVVLYLLTKSEKRFSPLYILNTLALVFNILRLVLICCYYTGAFNDIYNDITGDFSSVPTSAYGVSIAATIFSAILTMVVLISLLMQVQVVCITLRKKYRQMLLVSSAIIASGTVASKFYLAAVNIKNILNPSGFDTNLSTIHQNTNIVMTVTIFWFSIIFVAKLGLAIHQRKKLGLRRWGSMQIIFTMGCQTLFIPAIFSILQNCINLPALGSFELTLVALFLPLSSLWAASAIDDTAKLGVAFASQNRMLSDSYAQSSRKSKQLSTSFGGSTSYTSDGSSPVGGKFRLGTDLV